MALGVGWLHGFILILSSTLSCFCKEIWTFGVGWLREFIWILSSTLSCFCKEMWTSGIRCLHDFYTCAQLLYHRQEVNLKTFNTSFYSCLKFKDFPVISKDKYTFYTSMLHVEMMKRCNKSVECIGKNNAVGVLQIFNLHFWFSAILQLFANLHTIILHFFIFLHFSKMQSYILNAPPLRFLRK